MNSSLTSTDVLSTRDLRSRTALELLEHAIGHAAHLLPAQGPINVFIHHNTLHAFEEYPFPEAVKKGAQIFGCQPYLTEDRYRTELAKGRIRFTDLEAVLRRDLESGGDERVLPTCTRFELRLAMLLYPLRFGPTEELLWFVAETEAARKVRPDASAAIRGRLISETRRWVMRDLRGKNEEAREESGSRREDLAYSGLTRLLDKFGDAAIETWDESLWEAFALQALWRVACERIRDVPDFGSPPSPPVRHRDLLLAAAGVDTDLLVHEFLVTFCGAFLDQGLASWQLPRREEGFSRSFRALFRHGPTPTYWLRGLSEEIARLDAEEIGPLESILESLEILGVDPAEWNAYLSATLLALPGWGGMVHFLEEHPDRVVRPIPQGSLIEFLAVRLMLDRLALQATAREALGFGGPLEDLRTVCRQRNGLPGKPTIEQRGFLVFQLAQVFGWTPEELHRLEDRDWHSLLSEIEAFSAVERRRIFHLAYERRFVSQSLDALALHRRASRPKAPPRFQAVFCIDDREESIRRHLEEIAPDSQTFGAAGFFGVAMYYRGAADAHFVPLCPIIIKPQHWVAEQVGDAHEETHQRRARARRALGAASHKMHVGSRTFALGAVLAAGVGVLATIPLVGRILFPRLTARIRSLFGRIVRAPQATNLQLERSEPQPGPETGRLGYSLAEMAAIAERQLRDIGSTSGFARIFLVIGHGSFSLNNPHKSAYDCGACGGAPGAPNGRALAQMLNDPRIREHLAQCGIIVPKDTVFIGGLHNTCDDSIELFDLERVPDTHREELARIRRELDEACARNAHERCRRFMSAPLTLSFADAKEHVENRSEDLAQTRPELGHATNALCIVARRERTRGLFLDRRAFLTSYDPAQDDEDSTILTRLLQAAVPVCGGINLEYYFSRVDTVGWGCNTKLPHNVVALLGVMEGASSDLRTGLPWQMVEIHEPVRILFVIETTPDKILNIMERQPGIGTLIRNGWVLLAVLDPETQMLRVYRDGMFEDYAPQAETLPRADTSVDWYRGWRDHLEFAEIGPTNHRAG